MINYKKLLVLWIVPIIHFTIFECEHHCFPPVENFERTLAIRQPLTSKGDGDAYLNSHLTLEKINGRFDIHDIVAKWTRFEDPVNYRTYFKLDLSEIKDNEEIESAYLYLHTKPKGSDNKVPDNVNEDLNPNYVQILQVKGA